MLNDCECCHRPYELERGRDVLVLYMGDTHFDFAQTWCPYCMRGNRIFCSDIHGMKLALANELEVMIVRGYAPDQIVEAKAEADQIAHEEQIVADMERYF